MANAPELAEARRIWSDDAGFVAQIDYQLEFRSYTDFMSRDPAHLGKLLAERPDNMGFRSMSLYMTAAEVAEMRRRDALGDKATLVVRAVTGVDEAAVPEGQLPDYGPNFGGIWGDQLDGGRMVLAVVDSSKLNVEGLEPIVGVGNLKIIETPFTYNEIEKYRELLATELDELGLEGDIAAVRSDAGRTLEVRVKDPQSLPDTFGSRVPLGAFRVVEGAPIVSIGTPDLPHTLANQQPGLAMTAVLNGVPQGSSTWGFNGHTAGYHYIVACGHCLPEPYDNVAGRWVGEEINFWQGGSSARDITPGDTFLVSIYTNTYNSDLDVSRIESSYANDNCYHGDNETPSPPPHCGWPMANRALHNSWEEDYDRTCASLPSSGVVFGVAQNYKCGFIIEENVSGNHVRVGMTVYWGDSGAGVKWEYRIDGILNGMDGDFRALFNTAYDVKAALQAGAVFDFNCYSPGAIERANPSLWGVCPAVDA